VWTSRRRSRPPHVKGPKLADLPVEEPTKRASEEEKFDQKIVPTSYPIDLEPGHAFMYACKEAYHATRRHLDLGAPPFERLPNDPHALARKDRRGPGILVI
jgi:hypothetical protein